MCKPKRTFLCRIVALLLFRSSLTTRGHRYIFYEADKTQTSGFLVKTSIKYRGLVSSHPSSEPNGRKPLVLTPLELLNLTYMYGRQHTLCCGILWGCNTGDFTTNMRCAGYCTKFGSRSFVPILLEIIKDRFELYKHCNFYLTAKKEGLCFSRIAFWICTNKVHDDELDLSSQMWYDMW